MRRGDSTIHNKVAVTGRSLFGKRSTVLILDEFRFDIHCMKSDPPGDGTETCLGCPYYGPIGTGYDVFACRSDEAHRMAIRALEKMMEDV